MTPEAVAGIVRRRSEGAFINILREADANFLDPGSSLSLLRAFAPNLGSSTHGHLRRRTALDPSAYIDGSETGWYDAGYRPVPLFHFGQLNVGHRSRAQACPDGQCA